MNRRKSVLRGVACVVALTMLAVGPAQAADATWNANANGAVAAFALYGTTIYVGGRFSSIGGQTRNGINFQKIEIFPGKDIIETHDPFTIQLFIEEP